MAGARAKAINEKKATKIFDLMEYFAGYGFNKSHSTAYAFLAYQTAYLKANFPWHFAAALLTTESQNTEKLATYMGECRERGIPVLFVLMPEYLSAPYAPAFLREFERRFGVPLTVPPPDMVERFGDRGLYLDVFHLNRDGGAVYTDWLAERIRADGG